MTHRILVLEDSDIDFALLMAEFKATGFECTAMRAESRRSFLLALDTFDADLILSDYFLIGLTGLEALEIARQRLPNVPFIILTNALNEETAVECMKKGATDYVIKSRLPRLVSILRTVLGNQALAREKARIEREQAQIFELTTDFICFATRDGQLRSVNPTWTRQLGYPLEAFNDRPLESFAHPDDRPALAAWWRAVIAGPAGNQASLGRTSFECRFLAQSGDVIHILWNAATTDGEDRVFAHGHDITTRKHAEAALRESENRFRTVADSAPVMIWVSDLDHSYSYFNHPWLVYTGRTLEEEKNRGWLGGMHPEDRARCRETYETSFAARTAFRLEFRLRRADGLHRWVINHGIPRFDRENRFAGYIGSCIDINDQHEAETNLTLRAIKQAALAGFGRFALNNHGFDKLIAEAVRLVVDTLRMEVSQVLAVSAGGDTLRLTGVMGDDDADWGDIVGALPPHFDDRVINLIENRQNFPGREHHARLGIRSGLAIPIVNGTPTYGFLTALSRSPRNFNRDTIDFLSGIANILGAVGQRERAEAALEDSEQKLLQSQRLEAVGLLAGGVSHDFNNLLTAIRCYADLLKDDVAELAPEAHAAQAKVQEILKATSRASALTRQLLAFSRKQIVQPELLDLNYMVADLRELIRSLLSENIQLDIHPSTEAATLEADRSQLEQVIINLSINGRDAMPNGGILTLTVALRDVAASQYKDVAPGRYVELSVADNGHGMSTDVQNQLFQPFFTTKPSGRGTGLGLATCHVIVKHYQGSIHFESAVGVGTTFHVLLRHVALSEPGQDLALDPEPEEGNERILLVEDDEPIRTVTTTILERLGYRVHAVESGIEALAWVEGPDHPHFDLLLTDIVMPGMGGRALAERLATLRPKAKVIYMSGYVDDEKIQQIIEGAQVPFLEKPFTQLTLARRIREALTGNPDS